MEFTFLLVQFGIFLVQSTACAIYGCRTSDKIEELEKKLQKLTDQTAVSLKRIMARKDEYRPPQLIVPELGPSPSAPGASYPKTYDLDIIY